MNIGEEECGWVEWMVWTIIKWSGIAVAFFIAVVVGWLAVLLVSPTYARDAAPVAFTRPPLVCDANEGQFCRWLAKA